MLVITGCESKVEERKEEKPTVFELYAKVNPLVKFTFETTEIPKVTEFDLVNDKAKEIFENVDFKEMELMKAIELYGTMLKTAKIEFETITIFTTWENTEYFKSDLYRLKVEKKDNLDNIEGLTKPQLLYNQKYYNIDDTEHEFNITFKEGGVLEYHIKEPYTQESCDQCIPDECTTITIDDEMYANKASIEMYYMDGEYVMITGKPGEYYTGWYKAYDKCTIGYRSIQCDYYNAYHGTVAEKQYSTYYEIRN